MGSSSANSQLSILKYAILTGLSEVLKGTKPGLPYSKMVFIKKWVDDCSVHDYKADQREFTFNRSGFQYFLLKVPENSGESNGSSEYSKL